MIPENLLLQMAVPVRRQVEDIFVGLRADFLNTQRKLEQENALLRELVRLLQIDKFGAGSEKLTDAQLARLEREPSVTKDEVTAEANVCEADKKAVTPPEQEAQQTLKGKGSKKRTPKRHPVRQPLPATLRRQEHVIPSSAEQCQCKCCGQQTRVIGYEESERLSVAPAHYFVEVTKREKRACPHCPQAGVSTAAAPACIVEKGVFSNDLVVDVIEKKYAQHLPLYRQAQQIERDCGYAPSLSTLSDCVLQAGALLRLVKEAMRADLLAGGYIQADETTVPVQVPTKHGSNHTGYFWQYSRPNGPVVYEFRMGRERAGPEKFLRGYSGILQSDGYAAYQHLETGGSIQHACCLAHVRRKFYETLQVDPGNAHAGLVLLKIGELYDVEAQARKAGLSAQERGQLRARSSVKMLAELKTLVVAASVEALPRGLLGRACQYALKLWERLELIMSDGRIEVDNNWVENGMRPIALGRKNWLHIGSEEAGTHVAAVASVVETCKRNAICVKEYLRSVLPGLNGVLTRDVAELTPLAWKVRRLQA